MAKLFMLCVLCFLLRFVSSSHDPYKKFSTLDLTGKAYGPDCIAFDRQNEGPYVTTSDGRILKYYGAHKCFQDFAYTSPNRSKALCDGTKDPKLAKRCGKGFGLAFNHKLKSFFVADAFRGLLIVGPSGGLAKVAVNSAKGVKVHLANGVDSDPTTGNVVFTDGSQTSDYRDIGKPNFVPDSTGRLILYDIKTKKTKVLLKDLCFPIGAAFSTDGSFILIPLLGNNTVIKYWLKGSKANTYEVLLKLPGSPRRISRAFKSGEFWVPYFQLSGHPSFISSYAYKINSKGAVLLTKNFTAQYPNARVTGISQTSKKSIYVGSRFEDFLGKYEM